MITFLSKRITALTVLLLVSSFCMAQSGKDSTKKSNTSNSDIELAYTATSDSLPQSNTLNKVRMKPISQQPYISLQQMLKGNTAGVYIQEPSGEPGTEQNIFIRGISTPLLSKRELHDAQPAVYLNGIPLIWQENPFAYDIQQNDFNRIGPATNLLSTLNVDNIQSIEVVKDPVMLAKLGPNAANGAIMVTTKSAHAGYREISVNSYYGIAAKPSITPVNALYENNFRKPFYDKYATIQNKLAYPAYLKDSTNSDYYGPSNWGDLYFRNAPVYNVDLSLTGGSDRANFRFLGGYTRNANADATDLKKYTASFFINMVPYKWLTISSMINANRLERGRNRNLRDRFAEERYIPDLTNPLPPNKVMYGNYLSEFSKSVDKNVNNAVQGYFSATMDISKLKYTAKIAFDYNEGIRDVFWPTTLLEGNNFVSNYFGYNQRLVVSNTLDYDFLIQQKHKINVEAAQVFQSDVYKYDYAYAYNTPNDFIKLITVTGNGQGSDYLQPGNNLLVYRFPAKEYSRLSSYYGKISYDYNKILQLSAMLRTDGSSVMQPNHWWAFSPAFGAQWDIKQHLFLNSSFLDAFALRASWSKIGKTFSDDRFAIGPQYKVDMGWAGQPAIGTYNGIAGISRPYTSGWVGYGIPWQYVQQLNIGTDISFWNSVRISLDVYSKDNKNMLVPIPVAAEWGYGSAYQSGMAVNNKGVDFAFSADILKKENGIKWTFDLNLNYNKNKLTALPNGLQELIIGSNKLQVGKPVDSYWLLENNGIYNSASDIPVNPSTNAPITYNGVPLSVGDPIWKDVNGDHTINDKDKTLQGNIFPKITGGFGSSIAYKALTVDFNFYFALGQKILNQNAANHLDFINNETNNDINSVKEITYWQKSFNPSAYPLYNPWSSVVPYRLDQNLFLNDASFLKLRSVSIGYDLSTVGLISRQKVFKKCLLYVSGTNLFTVSKFKDGDPELANYNGLYTGYGMIIPRTYTVGVKIDL